VVKICHGLEVVGVSTLGLRSMGLGLEVSEYSTHSRPFPRQVGLGLGLVLSTAESCCWFWCGT